MPKIDPAKRVVAKDAATSNPPREALCWKTVVMKVRVSTVVGRQPTADELLNAWREISIAAQVFGPLVVHRHSTSDPGHGKDGDKGKVILSHHSTFGLPRSRIVWVKEEWVAKKVAEQLMLRCGNVMSLPSVKEMCKVLPCWVHRWCRSITAKNGWLDPLPFIEQEARVDKDGVASSPINISWLDLKVQHPGKMVLNRRGDCWEMFGEDAEKAAKVLGMKTVVRNDGVLFSFSHESLEANLRALLSAGCRVAVCDVPLK